MNLLVIEIISYENILTVNITPIKQNIKYFKPYSNIIILLKFASTLVTVIRFKLLDNETSLSI